jgi:hypothetical protein
MSATQPETSLDARYSSENATPVRWDEASEKLERAEIYWVVTVRPDGRPHVTPLIGVWLDGALHFTTGEDERKRRNLAGNSRCIVMTGCNAYGEGLDVIVEGAAVRVTGSEVLQRLADAYEAKYGAEWHFDIGDGGLVGGPGNVAWVYRVASDVAFGYGRGDEFSQTRWRF